jgi:hypothetical protein
MLFMMRYLLAFALAGAAFAEQRGSCERAFEAQFRPAAELQLQLRAGDVDIAGSDSTAVRVECRLDPGDNPKDVAIVFEDKGQSASLRISGGPTDNVRFRILVPRESNLRVRFTAGDMDISGIRGHLDIGMRAGDLTVHVGDPNLYSRAEASVKAGDIQASAFGVHKGGLFRSFRHDQPGGRYRLRASLWAGDIKLR